MNKVLVLEADKDGCRLLRLALDQREWRIETISPGSDLAAVLVSAQPDVLFLDSDGEDGEAQLQAASTSPVLVMAATRDPSDARAIELLALGADAVYAKPLAPDLLAARLNAALRCRAKSAGVGFDEYVYGELSIGLLEPRVYLNSIPVHLSQTEYRVLKTLAVHAGRILTHEQLLRSVWGEEYEGSHELLRTVVSNIRARLRASGCSELIRTERQLGYWIPRPKTREEKANLPAPPALSSISEPTRAAARLQRERLREQTERLFTSVMRLRVTTEGMNGLHVKSA